MQFIKYFYLIQYLILYDQYNYVMALIGPTVRQAEPDEFPAIVSIINLIDLNDTVIELSHTCTGTLVSRQDVLTAEHCLRETFVGGFKVMYGSSDLHQAAEKYPIYIWTYDHWIMSSRRTLELDDHDVAFIKLNRNVAATIAFAPVGNIVHQLLFGLYVVTAGWGRLINETKPRHLHALDLKILTKRQCEAKYYNVTGQVINLDFRVLCTIGNPYGFLYRGDSGGPLLFYDTLIGINNGVCPPTEGVPEETQQINLHYGLRYYYQFYVDITTTYRINFA